MPTAASGSIRVLSRSLTRTPRLRPLGWLGAPARLAFLISPQDEQHQAQPVEPAADVGIGQAARPPPGHASTFGPTSDRPRQVDRPRRRRGAPEDEALGHHGLRLELADQLAEALDLGRSGDDECLVRLRVGAQLRAHSVQAALQLLTDRSDARVRGEPAGEAERARSLVHRAEGLDAWTRFGRAATTQQPGRAVVAGTRKLEHPFAARLLRRRLA